MKNYYKHILDKIEASKLDIKRRDIINGSQKITLLYISELTDKTMLANDLIKPINIYISQDNGSAMTAKETMDKIIYGDECSINDEEDKIIEEILNGMTIILFSNYKEYIIANIKKVQQKQIQDPKLTYSTRGSGDCFNENLDTNLSLVRYRVKDESLNINIIEIGRRTKTRVAILHVGDIANQEIVNEITNRMKNIDVDGIVDSGEINALISNKGISLFPQCAILERSDMAATVLLEGKIIIIVDGSLLALVAPAVFSDFLRSCDDLYDNKYIAFFTKCIRIVATFLSFSITALYIAIVCFNVDTLPSDFVVIVSSSNSGVPFSTFVGIIILEFIIEIVREALIRVPKKIGSAIGIVAAIVIGQASIAANLFNPISLVVAAISLLTSFTLPDYTLMNSLRVVKIFLIIVCSCFGLIGFTFGISVVLINLVSINSFGVPYLAPIAPFKWPDFRRLFYYGKDITDERPAYLKTKQKIRMKK